MSDLSAQLEKTSRKRAPLRAISKFLLKFACKQYNVICVGIDVDGKLTFEKYILNQTAVDITKA
jgi:hypothetical protein